MNKFLWLSFSFLLVTLAACQSGQHSAENLMLKPGAKINGMIITTGASGSPALCDFCSQAVENEGINNVDCQVPSLAKLAIGYPFDGVDHGLQALDWSALRWELSLDGQRIDLQAFGIYEFVFPDLAPSPSPIREIFGLFKAWDVILLNPTPGAHTLSGSAYDEANTYRWTVNLTIKAGNQQ